MMLLILDTLIYNLTSYSSYLFLLLPIFLSKKDLIKIIIFGLVIDNVLLSTYFLNTIILVTIFLINKYGLKIFKKTSLNYFLISNFNFIFYYFILSLTYGFNVEKFTNAYFIHVAFVICSYNSLKKYIKLSR